MSWFVLYTSPRAEKAVAQRLESIGADVYLPLHKTKRKWSDRIKIVEVPLFNSYVFVRAEQRQLGAYLSLNGVVRVVYYMHKPAVVRDDEIEAIKEFLKLAAEREIIYCGDTVTVTDGALREREGKILYIKGNDVVLYLEELGAKVCVSKNLVEKVVKK